MREKVEQLARGNFKYKLPELLPSETRIEVSVETGSTFQGSFSIHNSEGSQMKGVLYSTSKYLILERSSFVEGCPVIHFLVDAHHLEPGEKLYEKISIITNCGEIEIPVAILVEEPFVLTSLGKISHISQLAELSKSNWEEACQVFKSDQFKSILNYYDKDKLPLYFGLKKSSSTSQALDEFLIATHKKKAVTIQVSQQSFTYDGIKEDFEDCFTITTQEWGYVDITIISSDDFVVPERKKVWAECFVNHELNINFLVKAKGRKPGIHHAVIVVETSMQTIEIKIQLHCIREDKELSLRAKNEREIIVHLIENYMNFRCESISLTEYVQRGEVLIRHFGALEQLSLIELLYQIHFKIISGQLALASNMIFALEEKYEECLEPHSEYYGVLLYLKTLCDQKDDDLVSIRMKECLSCNRDSMILFWIHLYLDQTLLENRERKYLELKKFMESNHNSPILYYEAAVIIIENPAILKKAEAFERRLFMFMLRQKMMTKEVMLRCVYLIEREKTTEKLNYLILKKIYEQYQISDALRGMLSLLIRNHDRNSRNHLYFEEGIKRQLRITELPEYYIYTMDESKYQTLPETIISYFRYHNNLPENKRLFYYCCLLENARLNPKLIIEYHDEVIQFLTYQIRKKNKSNHLAVLCNSFLQESDLNSELSENLPKLSFSEEIQINNPKMKAVAVWHKELESEEIFPITQGKSIIYRNTNDSNIFLIDMKDHRYCLSIPYQIKERYQITNLYSKMLEYAPSQYNLLLYCLTKSRIQKEEEAVDLERRIIELSNIGEYYRKECWKHLVQYYYDHGKIELLESYLLNLDVDNIAYEQQNLVIEFLITREFYEEALQVIKELGYEGTNPTLLLQLCICEIEKCEKSKELESLLMEISYYCFFHKVYNKLSLQYLSNGYNGTTKDMLQLWRIGKEETIDLSELEERLLGQMLFTESHETDAETIFLNYYKSGSNHKLITAYLSYYSYKYLLFDRTPEKEIFEVIYRKKYYEDSPVMLMALLKYDSVKDSLSDEEINFIRYHFIHLQQKDMILPFFKKFKKYFELPSEIGDKFFVEHRTDPRTEVTIHYCLKGAEFCSEKMKNVYYGIFVKEFILFEGENLEYYITEKRQGEEILTESKKIVFTTCDFTSINTNYDRINQIIKVKETKEEEVVEHLLTEYALIDYASNEVFHPL